MTIKNDRTDRLSAAMSSARRMITSGHVNGPAMDVMNELCVAAGEVLREVPLDLMDSNLTAPCAPSTQLCGAIIHVGDSVKVRYSTGRQGTVTGIVTKVWPFQAQVNNGWCFHDNDELLEHSQREED